MSCSGFEVSVRTAWIMTGGVGLRFAVVEVVVLFSVWDDCAESDVSHDGLLGFVG